MFEMATSFNSQQIQFRPRQLLDADSVSEVEQAEAKEADRDLLKLFSQKNLLNTLGDKNGKPWAGDDLCEQLICRIKLNAKDRCAVNNGYEENLFKYSSLQDDYSQGVQTKSDSENLKEACALESATHRILVVPDFVGQMTPPYRLYSCLTSREKPQCVFETKD